MMYLFLNESDHLLFKAASVTNISVDHLKDSCQSVSSSQGSIFFAPLLQGETIALAGLRAESVPVAVVFSIFDDLNVIGTHDDILVESLLILLTSETERAELRSLHYSVLC